MKFSFFMRKTRNSLMIVSFLMKSSNTLFRMTNMFSFEKNEKNNFRVYDNSNASLQDFEFDLMHILFSILSYRSDFR